MVAGRGTGEDAEGGVGQVADRNRPVEAAVLRNAVGVVRVIAAERVEVLAEREDDLAALTLRQRSGGEDLVEIVPLGTIAAAWN